METQIRRKNMLIISHRNQEALTIDVFRDQDPPFTQRNEFQSRDWNRQPASEAFVCSRAETREDRSTGQISESRKSHSIQSQYLQAGVMIPLEKINNAKTQTIYYRRTNV